MLADNPQRIVRLTPLAELLARVDARVTAVPARRIPLFSALGMALAEDLVAPQASPARPLAWRDGWALRADETTDAGPYAPAPLRAAAAVAFGDALPAEADAVALDDIIRRRGDAAEALAALVPGEGVLMVGADAAAGETVCGAGDRLNIAAAAALHALGITEVAVRAPQVVVAHVAGSRPLAAAAAWVAAAVSHAGGVATPQEPLAGAAALDDVLVAAPADMVIVIGGTGTGDRDRSVQTLARVGRVEAHGIGVRPGETAAFGMVGARPVLLVPGRLDAAFAVWLTVGHRIMSKLCDCAEPESIAAGLLARKIASRVGLVEVVPVRRVGGEVVPLASGHLPLAALAQADGWVLVPADSEGFAAGSRVEIRPLP